MKKFISILCVVLSLCFLASCAGTPVIYHVDCDCPKDDTKPNDKPNLPVPEGALKTGLAIATDISGSKDGEVKYDVTMVAVLVDENGVIQDCIIDGISTSVKFDNTGKITTDLTAAVKTKNELGKDYGMVAWGGAIAEWDAQAKAFANYVIGKTAAEVESIAVNEQTKPTDSDLSSSVTIAVGGFKAIVAKAVANAEHLGAQGGDELRLAAMPTVKSSKDATEAVLDSDVTALTMKDGKITSCAIDSIQAKVAFDATGKITSDLSAEVKTKNELGKDYGMVAWGGAIAEWDAQAAAFAEYITGKTPAEVAGISVNEGTKPTGSDLSSSVTIAIGGFMALIAKATK